MLRFEVKRASLKNGFFKVLAFDAFVGAPDRHGVNWGVLAPLTRESEEIRFASIFDTARGLFREYSDADLLQQEKRQGRQQFLRNYAERSRPILGTGHLKQDPKQRNHFALVKWILTNCDNKDHEAICELFNAVYICSIEHMLQRNFRRIITQLRIAFIRDLLLLRIQIIRKRIQQ